MGPLNERKHMYEWMNFEQNKEKRKIVMGFFLKKKLAEWDKRNLSREGTSKSFEIKKKKGVQL